MNAICNGVNLVNSSKLSKFENLQNNSNVIDNVTDIALKKRLIKHYLNYLNFKEQVTKMKNNDDWNPNGLIIKGYRKIYPLQIL